MFTMSSLSSIQHASIASTNKIHPSILNQSEEVDNVVLRDYPVRYCSSHPLKFDLNN